MVTCVIIALAIDPAEHRVLVPTVARTAPDQAIPAPAPAPAPIAAAMWAPAARRLVAVTFHPLRHRHVRPKGVTTRVEAVPAVPPVALAVRPAPTVAAAVRPALTVAAAVRPALTVAAVARPAAALTAVAAVPLAALTAAVAARIAAVAVRQAVAVVVIDLENSDVYTRFIFNLILIIL